MTRRRPPNRRPPAHVVFVDTNIIWYEDKAVVVNPQFDTFWDQHTASTPLELRVPSVVRGELLFQHSTSACKALDKASEQLERVRAITQRAYRHRGSHEQLRQAVERRFDRWLAAKAGQLVPVPVSEIDWSRLTEDAVWRRAPFVANSGGVDEEKGFRDALILETLAHYCDAHPNEQLVFVCNDRILREAAEQRVEAGRCLFFESLSEFDAYIELTRQRLTESFVKAIIVRARRKFFTPRKASALYYSEDVYSLIMATHEEQLTPPPDSLSLSLLGKLGHTPLPEWKMIAERIVIGNPQFQRLEEPRTFHWVSRVTLIRPYVRSMSSGLLSVERDEESQLIADFSVSWHSEVRANGTFRSMAVDSIELADKRFAPMSAEDRERYGLARTSDRS